MSESLDQAMRAARKLPPYGFMPGRLADGRVLFNVQFFASPHVPDDDRFYPIDLGDRWHHDVLVHPNTWTRAGARNLADAYRPEGVP